LAATRENKHIAIDVLSNFMSKRVMEYIQIIVYLFAMLVCALIAWAAYDMVLVDYQEQVQAFAELPAWYFELIIPLGFSLIAIRYLIHTVTQITKICSDIRSS
jgi:TRAP-type C4-dicarboxylate transport system permease small subunit